jgi:hypothetical protein
LLQPPRCHPLDGIEKGEGSFPHCKLSPVLLRANSLIGCTQITSFNNTPLHIKHARSKAVRLQYLPVAPSPRHPDNDRILELDGEPFRSNSYVCIRETRRCNIRILRPDHGRKLSAESYELLIDVGPKQLPSLDESEPSIPWQGALAQSWDFEDQTEDDPIHQWPPRHNGFAICAEQSSSYRGSDIPTSSSEALLPDDRDDIGLSWSRYFQSDQCASPCSSQPHHAYPSHPFHTASCMYGTFPSGYRSSQSNILPPVPQDSGPDEPFPVWKAIIILSLVGAFCVTVLGLAGYGIFWLGKWAYDWARQLGK